jgi:hypothetical protein
MVDQGIPRSARMVSRLSAEFLDFCWVAYRRTAPICDSLYLKYIYVRKFTAARKGETSIGGHVRGRMLILPATQQPPNKNLNHIKNQNNTWLYSSMHCMKFRCLLASPTMTPISQFWTIAIIWSKFTESKIWHILSDSISDFHDYNWIMVSETFPMHSESRFSKSRLFSSERCLEFERFPKQIQP